MEPDPPIISRITIKAVNNSCSLTVEWNPASVGNQCPIKAYTVYYREVLPDATKQRWRGELVSQPTSYRLNLKNLKCETEYEIAVTANNTKGESAKSKPMIRRTAGKIALYWQTQTQTQTDRHTRTRFPLSRYCKVLRNWIWPINVQHMVDNLYGYFLPLIFVILYSPDGAQSSLSWGGSCRDCCVVLSVISHH